MRKASLIKQNKPAARQWARRMIMEECVILDTETTGLQGYTLEIGLLSHDGRTLMDEIINPLCEVESDAAAIHGITQFEGRRTFANIYPELIKHCNGRPCVIYNAKFDIAVLARDTARISQVNLTPDSYQCAYERRQQHTGRAYGLKLDGGHRAIYDCQATLQLMYGMAEWGKAPQYIYVLDDGCEPYSYHASMHSAIAERSNKPHLGAITEEKLCM